MLIVLAVNVEDVCIHHFLNIEELMQKRTIFTRKVESLVAPYNYTKQNMQ